MTPSTLTVHVVDDDEAVRKSILYLLTAKGFQVCTHASGESFLESADLQRGGCVILDLRMGGLSGLQVFDVLRERASPLVPLFLSGHGDISLAVDATKKGAFGWLEKPCKDTVLHDTVTQAMEEAARTYAAYQTRVEQQGRWQTLTPREREVALQLRTGAANKVVARSLDIDVRTVETHRAKVYSKLGVTNPTELDAFLRCAGL
ncbi:response regulator [Curvibacter sp. APW13]|uniref:response regulator transcription factor n=1 Tax=Curvibacter sp. APW13 TaxID=3077236 RepID=UPI0028DF1361|nr:response regulator [Curvibacter sp. APW13]MDT8992513.1 response regulator [Curvibacter sp. APW13]